MCLKLCEGNRHHSDDPCSQGKKNEMALLEKDKYFSRQNSTLASGNAFWPTVVVGEADSVSSVSASACHSSGPKAHVLYLQIESQLLWA